MFATLSMEMQVLEQVQVRITQMNAHGGIFKTSGVAQQLLSAAIDAPVSVASGASEGGAWGMAILAAFAKSEHSDLSEYLNKQVFADAETVTITASSEEVIGFKQYLDRYKSGLAAVQRASEEIY